MTLYIILNEDGKIRNNKQNYYRDQNEAVSSMIAGDKGDYIAVVSSFIRTVENDTGRRIIGICETKTP